MAKRTINSEITLTQQCYEKIKTEIINGVLKPEEKLKVDMFKTRFSTGQSPIREALSQLITTGLVTFEDNKGFRVAPVSENNIRDTYATFTLIENAALKLSIERGDDAWEARVVAEFHKLSLIENREKVASYKEWSEQNYNFHIALISGCNSPTLLELQKLLHLKFDRYVCMAYQMNPKHASINHDKQKKSDHKKLMKYALDRDVDKAVELMTYHINGPLEDVIKIFKDQKLI